MHPVRNGGITVGCDTPVSFSDPYRAKLDCPQDIEGAKALLAEAGYPDGIDIELFTSDVSPGMIQFAEVYQAQVAPAGIRVSLNLAPSDGYWSDVWLKEAAVMTSWDSRPADQFLNEIFRTGVPNNETFYANADFDALLDKARSTIDVAAARALAASKLSAWRRVKLPLLKAPLLTATAIGFAVSIAQFVPAQLIAAGRFSTLPMEAVTLASGGNRPLTAAFALALAVPPLLAFLAAALLGRPRWR